MDSQNRLLDSKDSNINTRINIPFLKLDKIKETKLILEEEKKKK